MHEDANLRIDKERHAGFVIRNEHVLLIHRFKNGEEYWVFPGGHRRKGETGEEAALREIEEETNVVCSSAKLVLQFTDNQNFIGQKDNYYLCTWKSGETPELIGEEKRKNSRDNSYKPVWVALQKVNSINILPSPSKKWLLKHIKSNSN